MRFSVIIPNYNNAPYLGRCLQSVLEQTFTDYEIIFIDDMSYDLSVDIAKKLLRKQDKLIINKTKRLNGGTRNVGIVEAQGEYIICIDSDDFFKDNKVFEDINNSLQNNEDVLFLGYDTYFGQHSIIPYNPNHSNMIEGLQNCVCAIWTKVVKTSLLKETLFPEGTLFEDRIQHYRLLQKCKTFNCLSRSCILWDRTNSNSTSQRGLDFLRYEFHYAGELFQLIRETTDDKLKEYFKQELQGYIKHITEMAGEL